jgi:membrane protein DedA with SNARE-associated domain/membrane-associated phospholipid phosphatase
MPHSLDQILPSLESLGVLAYWIIGLAAGLEAWFVTGVFVPGALIVEAGGILVQQGAIDFFDLVWFVAIGSALGTEAGYWTGRLARLGLSGRKRFETSRAYARAERLFARHGGLALVLGRFLGPVAGLVPLVAAIAGMDRRRFLLWNLLAAVPYALAHVALGYFLGNVITRFGPMVTRVALLGAALVAALALIWWLVLRIARLTPVVLSVARSMVRAIGENPDVAAWSARHPGLARQLGRRLEPSRFAGLPATFLVFVFAYILFIWLGSVFDFLTADPIVQADERVANLVHAFWTPTLLRVAAHVTALGDSRVVGALFTATAGWLVVRGRRDLAAGLATAVIGNVASVAVLKAIFDRPRPALAYFTETTNSFPSGHAAISVAFWGMLFFIAWRSRWLGLVAASLLATAMVFAIGFSRIYLIEHYMTDVANGWLVGALWLVVGVAVAEWRAEAAARHPPGPVLPIPRVAVFVVAAACVGFAGWTVATYEKALNIPVAAAPDRPVADVAALLADPQMASTTESVMGTPLEPVNVILLATDEATIRAAMQAAGWQTAQPPSLVPLARAAWAAWTNRADDTAPVTPYFWQGAPNDLAFEKPMPGAGLRERHHVRVWQTRFVLADGRRVFVGAASFDDGLDPGIFHHIDPDIDTERDTLTSDLGAAGARVLPQVAMSPPRLGTSVAGDPWFTDGAAAVIALD